MVAFTCAYVYHMFVSDSSSNISAWGDLPLVPYNIPKRECFTCVSTPGSFEILSHQSDTVLDFHTGPELARSEGDIVV